MTSVSSYQPLIAHVMPWAAIGGTELATLRIARAVERDGFRSVMLCRADAPIVGQFFRDHGYKTVEYDPTRFWNGSLAARGLFMLRLAKTLRRTNASIVHCADVVAGDLAAIPARLASKPVVCHVRNRYDWLGRYRRGWLRLTDRVVFVSRHTGEHFGSTDIRLAGFRPTGRVVYDGFAPEHVPTRQQAAQARQDVFAEFGLPSGAKIVCMVARLAQQKDHETLILAAERIAAVHPHVRFMLVGGVLPEPAERKHAQAILARIEASPARECFLHTGFRSDIGRLLDASDVFVLCTHYEGLPLVILEAMAHGLPVVATSVDGIPEVVIEGRNGLLHRHQDADELAAKLLTLLQDEALASSMGEAARQFVAEHFSESRFGADMTRLYRELLRPPRAALTVPHAISARDKTS